MRRGCLILAGMLSLAGACDKMMVTEFTIGRLCSDGDECPPGQRCSVDGQCLEPCPTPGCLGEQCGCNTNWDHGAVIGMVGAVVCLSDGLCHRSCEPPNGCSDGMVCSEGLCYGGCGTGWCPAGRECVDHTSIETAHCRYTSGTGSDGGVGDGGTGDGGACTWCDTTCVDLQSDSSHCGACGHSCSGGECVSGRCRPVRIGGFTDGDPVAFGQDLQSIYLADASDRTIYRCGKSGCLEAPEIVVTDASIASTYWIGSEGALLYWLGSVDRSIYTCSNVTCSAPISMVAVDTGLSVPALDDSGLYFVDGYSGIRRCDLGDCSGGSVALYVNDMIGRQIAVHHGRLFFAAYGVAGPEWDLVSCQTPGCSANPDLLETDVAGFVTVAANDTHVFWRTSPSGDQHDSTVYTCPRTGCDPSPVAISGVLSLTDRLAASALGLFYTDGGVLYGWTPDHTSQEPLVEEPYVRFLVADDFYVFFVDWSGGLHRLAPWTSPVPSP